MAKLFELRLWKETDPNLNTFLANNTHVQIVNLLCVINGMCSDNHGWINVRRKGNEWNALFSATSNSFLIKSYPTLDKRQKNVANVCDKYRASCINVTSPHKQPDRFDLTHNRFAYSISTKE